MIILPLIHTLIASPLHLKWKGSIRYPKFHHIFTFASNVYKLAMYPNKVFQNFQCNPSFNHLCIFWRKMAHVRCMCVFNAKCSKLLCVQMNSWNDPILIKKKKENKKLGVAGHHHLAVGVARPLPFGPWGWSNHSHEPWEWLATPNCGQMGLAQPPQNDLWGGHSHRFVFVFIFYFCLIFLMWAFRYFQ